MLKKIISGGQTGADQAGLRAGKALGIETGGWIPKGRRTDDGPMVVAMFEDLGLKEHTSWAYPPRTEQNVLDSDGTVLFGNMDSPGCKLTIKLCKQHKRPYTTNPTTEELRTWIDTNGTETMNVAGNRERTNPGIEAHTFKTIAGLKKEQRT